MFKEVVLAIILGALLGFGVTGGIVALQKNQSTVHPIVTVPTTAPSPVVTSAQITLPTIVPTLPPNNLPLNIDSPQNEAIVSSSKVTITGTTSANTLVVIQTPIGSYHTLSDNVGDFSLDVDIDTGVNPVQISAINDQNQQTDQNIILTYTTAKI